VSIACQIQRHQPNHRPCLSRPTGRWCWRPKTGPRRNQRRRWRRFAAPCWTGQGRVKVADFGLAKLLGTGTESAPAGDSGAALPAGQRNEDRGGGHCRILAISRRGSARPGAVERLCALATPDLGSPPRPSAPAAGPVEPAKTRPSAAQSAREKLFKKITEKQPVSSRDLQQSFHRWKQAGLGVALEQPLAEGVVNADHKLVPSQAPGLPTSNGSMD
jgi:hypothetical protein